MQCVRYEFDSCTCDFIGVFRTAEISGIQFRYFLYIGLSVIYEVVESVSA